MRWLFWILVERNEIKNLRTGEGGGKHSQEERGGAAEQDSPFAQGTPGTEG